MALTAPSLQPDLLNPTLILLKPALLRSVLVYSFGYKHRRWCFCCCVAVTRKGGALELHRCSDDCCIAGWPTLSKRPRSRKACDFARHGNSEASTLPRRTAAEGTTGGNACLARVRTAAHRGQARTHPAAPRLQVTTVTSAEVTPPPLMPPPLMTCWPPLRAPRPQPARPALLTRAAG